MLILGHRGASVAEPENTLESFEAAFKSGADGLEFDVRTSLDGVPVLSHDRSFERRAGDARNIDEMTLAEIKTIDVGRGYRVPTLAETLELCAGRGFLDIEVKQPGIEQQVLEALEGYAGSWAISSFDWHSLVEFRRRSAMIELWPLAVQFSDALFDVATEIGAKGIAMHHSQIDEVTSAGCENQRFQITAWTVNDREEADRLRALGIFALCTDVPGEL
ncbi:glycerophosphodiester phosphodiesterase [soil metagenome]